MYTTSNIDPNELITRLERKFERKVKILNEYKRSREVSSTLRNLGGSQVRQFWRDYYDAESRITL